MLEPSRFTWYATGLDLLRWLVGRRRRYRVTGTSMVPTLQPGDHLLIDEHAYDERLPLVGEIVVATHPTTAPLILTKRVTACDRERVWLGSDHPDAGTDSRHFGPVARLHLIGRVTTQFRS